jgi:hypothetical protein
LSIECNNSTEVDVICKSDSDNLNTDNTNSRSDISVQTETQCDINSNYIVDLLRDVQIELKIVKASLTDQALSYQSRPPIMR